MGLSEEDQKKTQEQRLLVNGGSNMDRSPKNSTQMNEESVSTCASQLEGMSCCQTDNGGGSCCQKPVPQEKSDNLEGFTVEKKKFKKQFSRNNSGKATGPRKVCSMPTWYESWEREDTYAALAVVTALVSVAFAYKCYRQSS